MSFFKSDESFFDYADGKNTDRKLWIATKYTGLVSMIAATADVLLYTYPKGYTAALGRYVYFTVPMLGMSTAFVAFTDIAANVRGKDDKLNWAIGAGAAGVVFGAWRRSGPAGFFGSALFIGLALIKKDSLQNKYALLDVPVKYRNSRIKSTRDWTLTAHRPGNWVKTKE